MNTATPQVPNNLVWAILSTLFFARTSSRCAHCTEAVSVVHE